MVRALYITMSYMILKGNPSWEGLTQPNPTQPYPTRPNLTQPNPLALGWALT